MKQIVYEVWKLYIYIKSIKDYIVVLNRYCFKTFSWIRQIVLCLTYIKENDCSDDLLQFSIWPIGEVMARSGSMSYEPLLGQICEDLAL